MGKVSVMAHRKWIQKAIKRPGAFSRKAQAAKMTTTQFANKVLKAGSKATKRTKAQARLAKTLISIRKKKRS